MNDLYKQRFAEIHQQMELLLASKKNSYNEFLGKYFEEVSSTDFLEWKIKTKNLINKSCGENSEHYRAFCSNEEPSTFSSNLGTLQKLKAVFCAAREDYEGGYLRSTRSLIQAEVFDSELEQAQALLDAGYKVPAAVVAGIVLETSLRELSDRKGLPHGKLDKMNAELAKAGIFNKLQQKRITAIADIRNSAAHGKPDEFNEADVNDMIRDITRFVAEYL